MDGLLHEAVLHESVDVVRFLLSHGAAPLGGGHWRPDRKYGKDTPQAAAARDAAWVDLTDAAASSGTADAAAKAALLIDKAGYNGHVPPRWVDYAVRHGKVAALRAILVPSNRHRYLRLPHSDCEHLHTAVDCADDEVNLEILELLVVQAGDDVDKIPAASRPYGGETPLHVATRRGAVKAVAWLRQHGANVDKRGKNFGRTVRTCICAFFVCNCFREEHIYRGGRCVGVKM